jgi:CheY-like chemotaxis protein
MEEVQTRRSSDNKTILVVDDDPALLEFIHGLLKERGYCVLSARSGPEALRLSRDHPADTSS